MEGKDSAQAPPDRHQRLLRRLREAHGTGRYSVLHWQRRGPYGRLCERLGSRLKPER